MVALLGVATVALIAWRRRRRRWDHEARELLRDLRVRVPAEDPRRLAGELSELLRRIAMVRFGRHACAGLTGGGWLQWLEAHDPRDFPWTTSGRVLVDLPYAPRDSAVDASVLIPLIRAAEPWVADGPGRFDGPAGRAGSTRV